MADPVECDVSKALAPTNSSSVQIEKTNLDLTPVGRSGKIAYLLHEVFTSEECEKLIELTEAVGYTPALVHSGNYAALAPGYRDSQRVMVDDKKFVQLLFERIGHVLPQIFKTRDGDEFQLVEINERLRFLRYDPGDQFQPHCDATYERPDGSALTLITLQIYLNESYEENLLQGGETTFLGIDEDGEKNRVAVVPRTGIQHNLLHEGSLVTGGRKYTIRTDVLYRNVDLEED